MAGAVSRIQISLEAIIDAMRVELKGQRIFPSLIEPGAVKSEIWRKAMKRTAYPADGPARKFYGPIIDAVTKMAQKAAKKPSPPKTSPRPSKNV